MDGWTRLLLHAPRSAVGAIRARDTRAGWSNLLGGNRSGDAMDGLCRWRVERRARCRSGCRWQDRAQGRPLRHPRSLYGGPGCLDDVTTHRDLGVQTPWTASDYKGSRWTDAAGP